MSASQKHAWFNLTVVAATVVTVLALVPMLGPGAQGGFALLGLLGLGPIFFRRRAGVVVADERDLEIQRRSMLIAYVVFWLAFVIACVSLPAFYGWRGSVPVAVVQSSVWCAWILVVGVASIATLSMDRLGEADAS
ncbi:hypothetical protein [Paludisphaera mucosa]|uniref:Uncharacterized protein n=1 Tax=Paludisphaera mucosa TaxID=3030827 RepID=A0ABT6FAM1_9BACT|nr:hypothetical protein [Paludisphaera mucosa]MDG3004610.1 hypothetical protein [Paludisphaera mucosa]